MLESVRNPPGRHIQVKSAPELRMPFVSSMTPHDGLLGELLETDITILDNAESSGKLTLVLLLKFLNC